MHTTKKLSIAALLLAPMFALAQSYPSPTFHTMTLQNPLTTSNGGTGTTTSTGSGSVVLSSSPTLSTPNLGTPSVVTLTNGTGLPVSTGVTGLGTGVATGLSNAATGTGGPVLATSPTIASPTVTGTLNGTTVSATSFAQNVVLNGTGLAGNCTGTIPTTNYCANYFQLGAASPFDDAQLTDPTAFLNGLAILHNYGGQTGGRQTFYVQSTLAQPSAAGNSNHYYVAGEFYAQAASGDGGTATTGSPASVGAIYALNPVAVAYAGATNLLEVTSMEANISMHTGSSAWYKAGLTVTQGPSDQVQGSVYDTAIGLSNQAGSPGWQDGILFGPMNGAFPVTSTGCLICSSGSATAATGIDFSSLSLTNFLHGPGGFFVNGSGGIAGSSLQTSGPIAARYSQPSIQIGDTGSSSSSLVFEDNTTNVWGLANNTSTSQFCLNRYVSGSFSDCPIGVANSTGIVTFTDGIAGNTSGNVATAGNIGQLLTGQTSGTSLTTGTSTNATSINLTPGDWDVDCSADFAPGATTTISSLGVSISTTSATFGANGAKSVIGGSFTTGFGDSMATPVVPLNMSANTTAYCVVNASFGTSTMSVTGTIHARRSANTH
ncbi:hypothetical protein [Paraburkholderia sp. CNPSo 3281]|uniref:hypothetical protein n=1 Tax=Paraburkholderia sp. CNPSo 3281 TaxID=2940933 RepID=UPI0020B6D483|nr:hypothetical protein [Paraburkholderia sp. CNPSo 3281]MCP3714887.1 hypothetical protein [Paraburkholderia sp. CNPSo 3281]